MNPQKFLLVIVSLFLASTPALAGPEPASKCPTAVLNMMRDAVPKIQKEMEAWKVKLCKGGDCCAPMHGCYSYNLGEPTCQEGEPSYSFSNGTLYHITFGSQIFGDVGAPISRELFISDKNVSTLFTGDDSISTLQARIYKQIRDTAGPFISPSEIKAQYSLTMEGERPCVKAQLAPNVFYSGELQACGGAKDVRSTFAVNPKFLSWDKARDFALAHIRSTTGMVIGEPQDKERWMFIEVPNTPVSFASVDAAQRPYYGFIVRMYDKGDEYQRLVKVDAESGAAKSYTDRNFPKWPTSRESLDKL